MNLRSTLLASTLVWAVGCVSEDAGTDLLVPADVDFPWNDAYNEAEDGRSAVIPFDLMVYDHTSGEPISMAVLELRSDLVGLVAIEGVLPAEPDCSDCIWDAYRDDFVVLSGREDGLLVVRTDADGLARVAAVVDSLPLGDEGFVSPDIMVRHGGTLESVRLLPR